MKSAFLSTSAFALITAFAAPVMAQDQSGSPPAQDIIVTGTRQVGVKAANSAAPIELVGGEVLKRTGQTDLASALSTSVPSLNIQTNGGDTAALSIQAALRGLGPNDTLVLVDGKRRHTTANLAIDGGSPYTGSATTDLSFIPIGAIDHIEVLTDGAAAQYGSDAIAGVVNIILKKGSTGGSISATGGEYFNGQGENGAWSINKGFSLFGNGFLNVTGEERYHGFSVEGIGDGRYQNADGSPQSGLPFPQSNVTKATNFPYENRLNGDPQYNLYNLFYNAGYDLGGGVQLYSFGSFGDRLASHFENYRAPNKIITFEEGSTTPYYPFPDGFDPREEFKEIDYSYTAGIKGTFYGFDWDLSSTYGENSDKVYVVDSANAQLLPVQQALSTTPVVPQTTFYNGTFRATELTNNLDIDRSFAVGLASPLNVAFGFEQRRETFSIKAGEPNSYYGAGAQSFDGYTPLDQGAHARSNFAGYVDLAADVITNLHLDLAGRYEDYSDFGDAKVAKMTARYDFNPMLAFRGTLSTGFRAPTLAEEYYSGTNVSPYSADVVLPPNSYPAQVAGFAPLKPEISHNYSLGFVLHPLPRVQVTADAYEIDINNRILASGLIYGTNTIGNSIYTINQNVLNAIAAKGVTLDSGLSYTGIQTFANAANTKTQGVEATANYASDFGEFGHVDWSLGFNYNKTTITSAAPLPAIDASAYPALQSQSSFLTPNAATALTTATPEEKIILQAYWTFHKLSVNLRENIYGPTAQWTSDNSYYQKIGWAGTTDLVIGYKVTSKIKLEIGADNLFNLIPPLGKTLDNFPVGGGLVFKVPYSFAPWNGNGGDYYGRLTYSF